MRGDWLGVLNWPRSKNMQRAALANQVGPQVRVHPFGLLQRVHNRVGALNLEQERHNAKADVEIQQQRRLLRLARHRRRGMRRYGGGSATGLGWHERV